MQGALSNTPASNFDLEAKFGLVSAMQGGGPNSASPHRWKPISSPRALTPIRMAACRRR